MCKSVCDICNVKLHTAAWENVARMWHAVFGFKTIFDLGCAGTSSEKFVYIARERLVLISVSGQFGF